MDNDFWAEEGGSAAAGSDVATAPDSPPGRGTLRRIGSVALAVIGVWSLAQAVSLVVLPVQSVFALWEEGDKLSAVWMLTVNMVPGLASLFFGLFVIRNRHRWSERWFGDDDADLRLDALTILRVSLIVCGVVLVARVIPGLAASILRPIAAGARDRLMFGAASADEKSYWSELPTLGYLAVQLAVAAALVYFSRPLAQRLWLGRVAEERVQEDEGLPRCPACGTAYDPADYRADAGIPQCVNCHADLEPRRT